MQAILSRKRLVPALLALAIAPLALTANAEPSHDDRHAGWEQRQERLDAQRQALFERAGIDEATREALDEARTEHREAVRDLHQQYRERVNDLLDEEQREALKEARRELHGERFEQRRAAMQDRLEALVDGWGLSEEEREALREARESIYADLSDFRSREFDSREERRDAMRELRESHQATLAEILSDEQLEELKAAMMPRGGKERGSHGRHGHSHHGHGERHAD